jgi:hypothetical protein
MAILIGMLDLLGNVGSVIAMAELQIPLVEQD